MCQGRSPFLPPGSFPLPLPAGAQALPSVVRLSMKREEEVVVRSPSKGLKELLGEAE